MDYRVALPPFLSNLHDVFHVSQLRTYIPDFSHVIQVDDMRVRENLIIKASPSRVEDHNVKHLRGKEICAGEGGMGRTCWLKHNVGAGKSNEGVVSDSISLR